MPLANSHSQTALFSFIFLMQMLELTFWDSVHHYNEGVTCISSRLQKAQITSYVYSLIGPDL